MNQLRLSTDSYSIGSLGTCIQVPSLGLAFDMGMAPVTALHRETILLTHGHMDHISSVGHHIARRELLKLPPATYVMPPEMKEGFLALLAAYRELDKSQMEANIILAEPGDSFPLKGPYRVQVFPTEHVIPSLGYAIMARKKKLKPEFQGKSGDELRTLRENGVQVSQYQESCEIAFTGDTRADVLDLELVRKARLLIAECTFFGKEVSVDKARRTFHTHMDEIAARVDVLENEQVILTHFSARYKAAEIKAALAQLPPHLRERVRTFL